MLIYARTPFSNVIRLSDYSDNIPRIGESIKVGNTKYYITDITYEYSQGEILLELDYTSNRTSIKDYSEYH